MRGLERRSLSSHRSENLYLRDGSKFFNYERRLCGADDPI